MGRRDFAGKWNGKESRGNSKSRFRIPFHRRSHPSNRYGGKAKGPPGEIRSPIYNTQSHARIPIQSLPLVPLRPKPPFSFYMGMSAVPSEVRGAKSELSPLYFSYII